jgi:hypothetical protein
MLERIGEELGRFTDELAVERFATRLILQALRYPRLRVLSQPGRRQRCECSDRVAGQGRNR